MVFGNNLPSGLYASFFSEENQRVFFILKRGQGQRNRERERISALGVEQAQDSIS